MNIVRVGVGYDDHRKAGLFLGVFLNILGLFS